MSIMRANDRPTKQAPEANFTGQVLQDPVIVGTPPSRMRATNVSFMPSAWEWGQVVVVGELIMLNYTLSGTLSGFTCFFSEWAESAFDGGELITH